MRKFFSDFVNHHPLLAFLAMAKGNPKVNILVEPLWGIPFYLITPFATLYMYNLGVNDVEIGIYLSVIMVFQFIFSALGGVITDKFGRKHTTMVGDLIGWTLACFVWAISQNIWFFFVAGLLNCFEQINQTAWYCLTIEDAEEKDIIKIFTWTTIAGLLSVFVAPLSGFLIAKFTLIPVMRVLYATFATTMIFKQIITYKFCTETRRGKTRLEETKGVSLITLLLEYRHVIPMMYKNSATMKTLIICIAVFITNMINNTFFGLYVNQNLKVSEQTLTIFPIIRAGMMLIILFTLQHVFEKLKFKVPMVIGLCAYIVCQLLLIFCPVNNIAPIICFVVLESFASAIVWPRKESMQTTNVDPNERARIVAMMVSFTTLFSMPFGYLAGFLSSLDRRLPFCFSIVLFVIAIIVVNMFKEQELSKA